MSSRILTNIENTYSLYSVIFFIPQSGALLKRESCERVTQISQILTDLCGLGRMTKLCPLAFSLILSCKFSQIFVALEE